ncbi:MAG: enoyl-CoA hydratase-related protein [Candidatus Dormibacteraceae bacterium]
MAAPDPVLLELRQGGRIALVTLNRPEVLNAFNTETSVRLATILTELADRPEVRVVVLTGAGRAFSAGGDLKERQGMTQRQWVHQHRIFEATHHQLRNFRKPIFAAVNGVAVGGGCELAMSTDFIIASTSARFGQPEVSRGIIPGVGGTQLLPRFMPRGVALEFLMTGRMFSAEEALSWGLVNRVVEPGELLAVAEEIATRIAANSPGAVQQAKHAVRVGLDSPLEQAIEIELECYQKMVNHPDRFEGVTAFNEKRPPEFEDAY